MRQVLLRIQLGKPWTFWSHDAQGWPEVGIIWAWLIVVGAYTAYELWRQRAHLTRETLFWQFIPWLGGIPAGVVIGKVLPHASFPIFGYGFLVMTGFLVAVLAARGRAEKIGLDPDRVWDAGIWLLISGVAGGRLFYLLQYHEQVFRDAKTLPQIVFAAVNLPDGGLVLIGALVGGAIGLFGFCRKNRLSMLDVADAFTPSVFIGIGFGRIGCLLNGCCWGDRCELPWAISFPKQSAAFQVISMRGFLPLDAVTTMPLHPTQIYSSIDGFLLAIVTALLFRERSWKGEVFAWGCVLYSITRFLMEFIRGDEMGQLGTGLTISQIYSLGIAGVGIAVIVWHGRRAARSSAVLG